VPKGKVLEDDVLVSAAGEADRAGQQYEQFEHESILMRRVAENQCTRTDGVLANDRLLSVREIARQVFLFVRQQLPRLAVLLRAGAILSPPLRTKRPVRMPACPENPPPPMRVSFESIR